MTLPETAEYSADDVSEIQKYDIMGKMTPFMDKHMVLTMLMSLEGGIYKSEDIAKAIIKVGSKTSLLDLVADKYAQIGEEVPSDLLELREEIMENLNNKNAQVYTLLEILEDKKKVDSIPEFKTIDDMCHEFDIRTELVEELAEYAKMKYECGDYGLAAELLDKYRSMPHSPEQISPKQISCLWGHLAVHLVHIDQASGASKLEEAETATRNTTELIFKIDEHLENSKAPKKEILLHRTWLLHWTLFAIFSSKTADQKLLDFFLNEKSLSIISLSCPHLFRYVGACLILVKRLKHLVKDTVWIIHHESLSYSDPVTRFLLALYTEMDYDEAQRELASCKMVCAGDHFLARHWADFQENARLHIFESYCRIHQCINIEMLAKKLNMGAEEAELWIVKLIQSAKLDARIDSEKKRVVMTKAPPNVYQQVIEKTKNLAFRSTMLVSNMEKH